MNSRFVFVTVLCLGAGGVLLTPIAVEAGTATQTPVAAMVIDKPGVYTLDKDITVAAGDAVMITANGVTLDLGGHNVGITTPGQGRGIVVQGGKGVRITNGRVGPFAIDVHLDGTENVVVEGLQIVGGNLALNGAKGNAADPRGSGAVGFSEVGVLLTDARGTVVRNNLLTAVSAGIFIRGAGSSGSVSEGNTIAGGAVGANNFLAICFNGLPTEADPGPAGCVIQDNHVGHYKLGFLWQGLGTAGNISKENTLATWGPAYLFPDTAHAADNMKGTTMVNDVAVAVPAP